jgi:hypothetical protein
VFGRYNRFISQRASKVADFPLFEMNLQLVPWLLLMLVAFGLDQLLKFPNQIRLFIVGGICAVSLLGMAFVGVKFVAESWKKNRHG